MQENMRGRETSMPQRHTPERQMPERSESLPQRRNQIMEKRVGAARDVSAATKSSQDSPEFLAELASPDSQERQELHTHIVDSLQNRIEQTLMTKNAPTIGFSEVRYPGDNAIQSTTSPDRNGHYTLTDSEAFWKMIDERPEEFHVDCLNILPITIFGAMRDVLIERGHDPKEVDKLFTGAIFNGARSEVVIEGESLRLFGDDTQPDTYDGRSFRSFEQRISHSPLAAHVTMSEDPAAPPFETVAVNVDVQPGDVCGVHLSGIQNRSDYGNADSQNSMILNSVSANDATTPITMFAHRTEVADRDATLVDVLNMLATEVDKRGLPLEEAGYRFTIARVDYVSFYAELAKQLSK